jgi:hypothetical protein
VSLGGRRKSHLVPVDLHGSLGSSSSLLGNANVRGCHGAMREECPSGLSWECLEINEGNFCLAKLGCFGSIFIISGLK